MNTNKPRSPNSAGGIPTYPSDDVCAFLYTRAEYGQFSNFYPLPSPIHHDDMEFKNSESLYQSLKFPTDREYRQHIANAPDTRAAKRLGRQNLHHPVWPINNYKIGAMRLALRKKLQSFEPMLEILENTGNRPIVEISKFDAFWGAAPIHFSGGPHTSGQTLAYRGQNMLGRLWMELRLHIRTNDPLRLPGPWQDRLVQVLEQYELERSISR